MRTMHTADGKPVDRPTLLRLAAEADADPRSIARRLRGGRIRGRAGERIEQALVARGFVVGDHFSDSRLQVIK